MKRIELISAQDLSSTITSVGADVGDLTTYSVHAEFSANAGANGTLSLQASNDDVDYIEVPSSSQAVTPGNNHLWSVTGAGYRYVRAKWVPTTYSGKAWVRTGTGSAPYTVTVTSASHGLASGATITVSGGSDADVDGVQTISRINANSFSFQVAVEPSASGTLDYTTGASGKSYSANNGSSPWTVTVTSNSHGIASGDLVISAGSDADVNGTRTITDGGANTFTFTTTADPSRTGTLTWTRTATGKSFTSAGGGPYTVTVASVAHGLKNGASITVSNGNAAVNGAQTITVGGDPDSFTFDVVSDPAVGTLDYTLTGVGKAYASVGSSPWTVNVASTAHGLFTGAVVTVSAGSDGDVDGSRTITPVGNDTFSFTTTADPSSVGTLTWAIGASGVAYVDSGSAPFEYTVTSVAHKLDDPMQIKITSGPLAGVQTLTSAASADVFTFESSVNAGASGTLDYTAGGTLTAKYIAKEPAIRNG